MPISLKTARKRLALVWFVGAAPIFLLVLVLSLLSAQLGAEVWSWFLPAVIPNLSLILGVWVMDTRAGEDPDRDIDPFMYRLTASLSGFYLLMIAVVFLLHPFSEQGLSGWLVTSQPWLTALQGLASLAMGAFYVQRQTGKGGA